MKCCMEWKKNFKYLPDLNEYNIKFKDNKTKELLLFLDEYAAPDQEKRTNIILSNEFDLDDVKLLVAIYKRKPYNIAICFEELNEDTIKYSDEARAAQIPFYFRTHVDRWDLFNALIDLGVSDVFITDEMGFDLERVSKVAKKNNVSIRCFANVSQYTKLNKEKKNNNNTEKPLKNIDDLKGFFIRPEDVEAYEGYIDCIEFWNEDVFTPSILYRVYFINKCWDGKLSEIIWNLENPVNNYYIITKEFAKRRISCQKKCTKGNEYSCQMCDSVISLAKTLLESDDYEVFKITKEEKEKEE